jgi:hypothetical protein
MTRFYTPSLIYQEDLNLHCHAVKKNSGDLNTKFYIISTFVYFLDNRIELKQLSSQMGIIFEYVMLIISILIHKYLTTCYLF